MNNIQNYEITNHQIGFQAKKVRDAIKTTKTLADVIQKRKNALLIKQINKCKKDITPQELDNLLSMHNPEYGTYVRWLNVII